MKWITKTLCLLLISATSAYSGQSVAIDLCKDNPRTLIGTKSGDYSIYGLRRGLTHDQAWQILKKTDSLMGIKAEHDPSTIYVYSRTPDGSKGEYVLCLVWKRGETKMSRIAVFQGFRSSLSQSFRRLLTFEAVDNNSGFKRTFIGYANRSKTDIDLPLTGLKSITYFYDEIGLEVTHLRLFESERVNFAIVQPKP